MLSPSLLVLGVVLGVTLVFLWNTIVTRNTLTVNLPQPQIASVQCLSPTRIQINGSISAPPTGATLVGLWVVVYNSETTTVPVSPVGQGATNDGLTFPITHTLPSALPNARNLVVVWAEYRVYTQDKFGYPTCSVGSGSGSGSGFSGKSEPNSVGLDAPRPVTVAGAEQLEAIPRAYRVSPGPNGGPQADLLGALAESSEPVLVHDPKDSTPIEPFWRARGASGPVRQWTLCLLHRNGGFGAVLTALCIVGEREVLLTWVTSDWRFHAANRLTCESEEARGSALVVRPA